MNRQASEQEEITSGLQRAVERSGLSQAAFARAMGTSPSRFSTYMRGKTVPSAAIYLRALRLGDAIATARQAGLQHAADAIAAVNHAIEEGDEDWALRMILQTRDDLRLALTEAPSAVPAWSHLPGRIADERYDVLLKAVIAHELAEAHAPEPTWASSAYLDHEWIMDDPFRDEHSIRSQTPDWLARVNIFIAERGLVTA